MADLDEEKQSEVIRITGGNESLQADVINVSGVPRLAVDSAVTSVNVPLGKDPLPDTYFTITAAGAIGDTVRIQIAATSVDSTTPDFDLPAVDYTYTLVAGDVGDEKELAKNIVVGLNLDNDFQNAKLEADTVTGDERAIIWITSTVFSLNGEAVERPNAGDVTVTPIGTTTVGIDTSHEVLISRAKEVSLARDPDNPHRLGTQNVSGNISISPGAISDRFEIHLMETGGDDDMSNFDGLVTPVPFRIDAVTEFDLFITRITIHGIDNSIKLQKFMGQNSALINGLTWEIKSDDKIFNFETIRSTREIKRFATVAGWELDVEASADDALSTQDFGLTPIVIRKQGDFTIDDYIQCTVNDDLSNVLEFKIICYGFKKKG